MTEYNYPQDGTPTPQRPPAKKQQLQTQLPQQQPLTYNYGSFNGDQIDQINQNLPQQPASNNIPISNLSAISEEEQENLIGAYINLIVCGALAANNGHTGQLKLDRQMSQDGQSVSFRVVPHTEVQPDLPFDQNALAEGFNALRSITTENPFYIDLQAQYYPTFQLNYVVHNQRTNEVMQTIALPLEEPKVPLLDLRGDKPAKQQEVQPLPAEVQDPKYTTSNHLSDPHQYRQSNQMSNTSTQQLVQTNQTNVSQINDYRSYDHEQPVFQIDGSSLIVFANELIRKIPLCTMNIEELQIIAQAYAMTVPTGQFVEFDEAAKLLTDRLGKGWSVSNLKRHIKNGRPFEWIIGHHYLGTPTPKFININAVIDTVHSNQHYIEEEDNNA